MSALCALLQHRFGHSIVVLPTPSSLDDAVRVMSDMATVALLPLPRPDRGGGGRCADGSRGP